MDNSEPPIWETIKNYTYNGYQKMQSKYRDPIVQEQINSYKTIAIDRSKEWGQLTIDYSVKSFQITKSLFSDLYNQYQQQPTPTLKEELLKKD